MDQVVLALEGAIAPMDCFLDDHDGRVQCSHPARTSGTCATKLLWTRVQMGVIQSLQRTTLAELVAFDAAPTVARAPETTSLRTLMADLEIKNLHVTAGGQADPQGRRPARPLGRVPRADGPERLRQVHARQRDHGPPEPRGHRGPDPLRRRGHHGGRPGRARPRRPVHGLPVPRGDPGRDRHEVPAHGHQRPPRGARRAVDLAQGLPQDGRGRDGAHATSRASSPTATSTTASPAARRSAWRSSSSRSSSRSSPCSTRPTRAWTSTRSTPSPHGVNTVAEGTGHGRPDHHPLPAHPAHGQAAVRAHHVRGPDRQGGRPGARHRARGARATAGSATRSPRRRHEPRGPHLGRVPRPRAGGPRLPRHRRHVADRAAGARGDGALLRDVPRDRSTAASTRSPRRPPRPTRARATGSPRSPARRRARRSSPATRPRRSTSSRTRGAARTSARATSWSSPRWSTTRTSCRGSCSAVPARVRPGHRRRAAGPRRARRAARRSGPKLVAVAHVSNVLGTINPIAEIARRAHAAGARGAGRRRAGRPAPAGRRGRARRRLLRLDRPQGLRADRHRRAARPPRAARGDAAVPRRRAHDRPRRRLRVDLGRAAGQVRGGHVAGRRGDRPRRRVDWLAGIGMDAVREHGRDVTGYALERLAEVDRA